MQNQIFKNLCNFSSPQIFERNPLCGLNYPCGKGLNLTNTCTKLNESYSMMEPLNMNYSNTSLYEMNNSNSGYENAMEPTLPRGFRICNQPNTALWSLILAITTFAIALFLRKLRYKKNLGKKVWGSVGWVGRERF